jgi:hypothetical protein
VVLTDVAFCFMPGAYVVAAKGLLLIALAPTLFLHISYPVLLLILYSLLNSSYTNGTVAVAIF